MFGHGVSYSDIILSVYETTDPNLPVHTDPNTQTHEHNIMQWKIDPGNLQNKIYLVWPYVHDTVTLKCGPPTQSITLYKLHHHWIW